jgi:hypothetical protein
MKVNFRKGSNWYLTFASPRDFREITKGILGAGAGEYVECAEGRALRVLRADRFSQWMATADDWIAEPAKKCKR